MLHHETVNPQMSVGHHHLVSPSAVQGGVGGGAVSPMLAAQGLPSNPPTKTDHQCSGSGSAGSGPANAAGNAPGALSGVRPPSEELCVEFDYVWPLNIAVLQAEGPKEPIACPEFTTCYKSISYKWQLLLYLSRPLSEFGEKYMGLYLCYKAGPVDFVSIDCEMFVSALDHSRACSNLARKVELEVEGRAWGYANFCPQDLGFLERSTKAMLIDGDENELKIGVTVRISTQYFSIRNFFGQFHPNKEAERLSAYLFEKVCLDFEFGAERADCRIIANDGAGFYANRAVLEYASPVLQQLLTKTNPFVENEQSYNEITVDDLTSPALREILHYVYKGVPSEHLAAIATEVVHGAHKFQLPNLKSLCEKAMVYQLSEKNAIKFLYTAETYQLPILLNMSLNMVVDRWPVLHASKEAEKLLSDKVIVKKIMDGCSARANCHLNLVRLDTGLRMQHQQATAAAAAAGAAPQQQQQMPSQPQQPQQLPSQIVAAGSGKTLPPLPALDDMQLTSPHLYSLRGPGGAAELLHHQAYSPQTGLPPHMLVRRGSEPQLQLVGTEFLDGVGSGGDGIGYSYGRTPIVPPGTLQAGTAGNDAYQALLNGTGLTGRQHQQFLQQHQLRQQQQQGLNLYGAGGSANSSPRRIQQHVTFSDMQPGQRSNLPGSGRVYQSVPRGSVGASSSSAQQQLMSSGGGRSASAGATPRGLVDVPGRLGHHQNLYSPVSPMGGNESSGNRQQPQLYSRISSSQPGGTLNMQQPSSSSSHHHQQQQPRGGGPPGGSTQVKQKPPLLGQISQQPTNLIAGLRSRFDKL